MGTVEPFVDPRTAAEVPATLDTRTQEILAQRRASGVRMRRGWLVRRMLVLADLVGLTLAFLAATLIFEADGRSDAVASQLELLIFCLSLPAWVIVAKLYGLYDYDEERTDHSTADDLVGVLHLVTVGSWLFFAFAAVTHRADPGFARLLGFWLFAIAAITGGRAIARGLARKHLAYVQNTIIVGAGDVGQLIAKKLRQHPEYGLNLVGFVDGDPKERTENLTDIALLGGLEQLPQMVQILDVERVIVAFSNDSHEDMLDLIRSLKDLDIQIDLVPRFFEVIGTNVGIHTAEGLPLIGLPALKLSRSSLLMKRTMDLALSLTGLLLLAPLFLVVAIWIKLDSRGPVFFRQLRMGSGDQTFEIFKFRTMTADAEDRKHEFAALNKHADGDPRMFKIPNDPRITRIGNVLRRFSIDELPQLINVVRGEMSLVGPRPLILEEDLHVVDWRRQRLNLKPGITGLWQVLGRDDIPFEEMVRLDYVYVTTWSMLNDLKLILRTIPALYRAREC
ncbi:MAG TPA: sugar transferase [Gaiellaceae bacterium]|nr:sugar transferase [Gaiellaceae bacterium]